MLYEEALKYMSSATHIYLDPEPEEMVNVPSQRYWSEVEGTKLLGTMTRVEELDHKELHPLDTEEQNIEPVVEEPETVVAPIPEPIA